MNHELRQLARDLADTRRRVRDLETAPRLGFSSIEGAIEQMVNGQVVARFGQQPDGTNGAVILDGPVPPRATPPVVEAGAGLLTVTWDGRFAQDAPRPGDFAAVEVFLAAERVPTASDLAGAILAPAGGAKVFASLPPGEYLVALRTKAVTGRASALTTPVAVTVAAVVDESLVAERIGDAIDEAMVGVGTDLALLDQRLGEAFDDIDDAIAAANGKNRILRRLTAAPETDEPAGKAPGDMWWQFADDTYQRVIGTWMWSGEVWVPSQLGHQVLASVDVGSLTVVGQATLAQAVIDFLWANVVRAKKITADMVLIGAGSNLAPDARWSTAAAWTTPSMVQATGGRIGGGSLLIPASSTFAGAYMGAAAEHTVPVKPGEQYRLNGTFVPATALATGRVSIYVRWRNAAGSWITATNAVANAAAVAAGVEHSLTTVVTVPAGVTHMAVGFYKQATHTGSVRWTDYGVFSMTDASLVVDGGILARHIDVIDLTAAAAFIERIRSIGVQIVNAEGEVVINLTGVGEQALTLLGDDSTPAVVLDKTGRVGAKTVTASDSLLYRGNELATYWSRMPEGLVAIGGMGQISGSRLYIAANREMGLFDVPVPVIGDRWYRVTVVLATYPSAVSPEVEVILRTSPLSQNVVVAPSSSPEVTRRRAGRFDAAAWDTKTVTLWFRTAQLPSFATPGSMIRLLLSVYVNGNTYVDQNTTMSVEAIGPAIPFTQTINQGGATTPPPGSSTAPPAPTPPPSSSRVTTTREWAATQHRSYTQDGGGYDGGAQGQQYAMQGYSSSTAGKGRQASLIFFNSPDIRAALSGADIEAVSIYVKNSSFFAASGGVARIMNHNQDGPGGTSIAAMSHVMDVRMGRGEGRWIEMPVQFAEMLKNGSSRGFGFAALGSNAGDYYGQFEAAPSRIAIRYTK